jgi:hypothetical protein
LSNFVCHLLLEHLCVVVGDGVTVDVLEYVLYESTSHVVEHEACIRIGHTISQTKMFLHRRNNEICIEALLFNMRTTEHELDDQTHI